VVVEKSGLALDFLLTLWAVWLILSAKIRGDFMAWTLQEAKEMLQNWINAEVAVSTGQSYKIGTRSLERANLSEIANRINFWRREVERLEIGRPAGLRVSRAVPRDL
jgi:hypothetical protein